MSLLSRLLGRGSSLHASRLVNRLVRLSNTTKHGLHCLLFASLILYFEYQSGGLVFFTSSTPVINPWEQYGTFLTVVLYLMQALTILALPQCICNFLGLTLYNAFPDKTELKGSPLIAPFLCIRTVTRGDYADLVRQNVARNINTCTSVGLENFMMEIATDKPLNLGKHQRIREVVVPTDYKTSSGAMFKARALQYCLEKEVNILGDEDWILHLDEETILTENAVRGVLNFIMCGKHEFGQGLITYANEDVVNWFTTLADSFRVADDMGKLRFQFYMFHRPLFSWKGSYVVSKLKAERDVTYDHGPDGSVAEDCYFSMIAYAKGYTFNFIEGELWEKSPFTIPDFLQQRKRWMQGIFLVVHSARIPWQNKLFLSMSLYAWMSAPITTLNLLASTFLPLPPNAWVQFLSAFVGATYIYMYIFGVVKSFSIQRQGLRKFLLCVTGSLLTIPFNIVIENIAVLLGLFGKKHKFFIVQKQIIPTHIV